MYLASSLITCLRTFTHISLSSLHQWFFLLWIIHINIKFHCNISDLGLYHLSHFSHFFWIRLLKRVVQTHDLHFLPSHFLLNPFQTCFCLQHFTETTFIKFTQDPQNAKSTSQFPVVTQIISSIQQLIIPSFWHTAFTWLPRLSSL